MAKEKEYSPILEDQKIKDWLNAIQSENTKIVYSSAAKTFFTWLGQSPTDFINAIDEDNRKPMTERRNLARSKLLEFHNYATTKLPHRNGGRNIVGEGVSYNAAKTMMGAIRSLLSEYGIIIKFNRRHIPKPKERSPFTRLRLNTAQIRSLLSNARTLRDRAIIITICQSGMDLNTLVSMKYKMVKAALEGQEPPVQLDLFRQKAAIGYFSFIGTEGIEAIKLYLQDLKHRGIELKDDDHLWLTDRNREPLSEHNIMKALRICAIKAGLINGEDAYNISGGHALREFFSSSLNAAKVPKVYIDLMLGHAQSDMDSAYFKADPQAIRTEYARAYDQLMLVPTGLQNGALRAKIDEELDKKTEGLIRSLEATKQKNAQLEERIRVLEGVVEEVRQKIKGVIE